jgi:phage portal protein BeeE
MAAVTMLCEDCAKLAPTIYRKNPDGSRVEAQDHELDPLLYTPNDYQDYFQWAEMMQFSLVMRGNGYAVKIRNGRGQVIKLIPSGSAIASTACWKQSAKRARPQITVV